MLRKFSNFLIIQRGGIRNLSTEAKVLTKEKYDIHASVLIERLPIISKKFNELENEVMSLLKKMELENSLKSDHELRKEKDKRQADMIKAGKMQEKEQESEARTLQTAQDFEDMSQDELSKFSFVTQEDNNNNKQSLARKLDDTLMFLCEHKLGNENAILLPQGKWIEGETLRQTAERIVKEKCGTNMKVHFYGNAPIGFYKYKYPVNERKNAVGAKVFFFRAIHKNGDVTDLKDTSIWINDSELLAVVKNNYYLAVKSFLC